MNSASNTPKQPSKKKRRRVLVVSSPVSLSSIDPLGHSVTARRGLDFSDTGVDPVQVDSRCILYVIVKCCHPFADCVLMQSKSKHWIEEEVRQLVAFVHLSGFKNKWPTFSSTHRFWSSVADGISKASQTSRSGEPSHTLNMFRYNKFAGVACRNKLNTDVRIHFSSPSEAFNHYYPDGVPFAPEYDPNCEDVNFDVLLLETFQKLAVSDSVNQLSFISNLFERYCRYTRGLIIPENFLELSLSAMEKLNAAGRTNVVYNLVKSIGTKRPGSEESCLPVSRMPMGLLEHCVNFFSSSTVQRVINLYLVQVTVPNSTLFMYFQCPDDYRQWLVSMFSLFGTKFVKMFNGPMWKVEQTMQSGSVTFSTLGVHDPMRVRAQN